MFMPPLWERIDLNAFLETLQSKIDSEASGLTFMPLLRLYSFGFFILQNV